MYEACPESIQPFWIYWEMIGLPWCNLAASQRRETLLCICEQSLSRGASQSAVRRRWLGLCTVWLSHSQWPSEQISISASMHLPLLQLSCRLFVGKASHHPGLSAPLQPRFGSLRRMVFPKVKIASESEEICERDGHTVHKLSQRRLTADWLAPRENDCSLMHSKVSSDWLPSYIKTTRPVLEMFSRYSEWLDTFRTDLVRYGIRISLIEDNQ